MRQPLPFFEGLVPDAPSTEGIKYIGSKKKLIPQIIALSNKVYARSVLDGFSGTTRVSQAFAKLGYQVLCNDNAIWSEVLGTCYLKNQKDPSEYRELIEHLNSVPSTDGWFTENYGGQPNGGCAVQADGKKKPWQVHNTQKLDGIRYEIEALNLDPVDKAVALTSLMLALDQVDSSLGHFASYLKEWSPRSYQGLVLRVPAVFPSLEEHHVFRKDIFDLLRENPVDLAYFDPPYGSNNEKMPPSRVRYAAYYHLWTSVCSFDKPTLFGKANRRVDTSDPYAVSVFEEFQRNNAGRYIAVEAIDRLIQSAQCQWIILSYSSGGRATARELDDVIRSNGKLVDVVTTNYKKNVMANMKWTNQWLRDADHPHQEFLFLIDKSVN